MKKYIMMIGLMSLIGVNYGEASDDLSPRSIKESFRQRFERYNEQIVCFVLDIALPQWIKESNLDELEVKAKETLKFLSEKDEKLEGLTTFSAYITRQVFNDNFLNSVAQSYAQKFPDMEITKIKEEKLFPFFEALNNLVYKMDSSNSIEAEERKMESSREEDSEKVKTAA